MYSFHQSILYISVHKDAVWTDKRQKRLQPDDGFGPFTSASGVMGIISGRHSRVLYGYLGPLEAPEEHCGGSHEGWDQDSALDNQDISDRNPILGT